MPGTLAELPAQAERKVGTTSSHHGPYILGHTRATMVVTEGSHWVTRSESLKHYLSSDRSLQLDSVKLESLVIAHQPWRGEYVPGPCTGRCGWNTSFLEKYSKLFKMITSWGVYLQNLRLALLISQYFVSFLLHSLVAQVVRAQH